MSTSRVKALDLHRLINQVAWTLPTGAAGVARILVSHINNHSYSWPRHPDHPGGVSVAAIARQLGRSPEHCRRALRVLEAAGLLETIQRPWQKSYYRLLVAAWQRAAGWVREQVARLKLQRPRTIPLPDPREVARRGLAWLVGAEGADGADRGGTPPRRSAGVAVGRRTAPCSSPVSTAPAWAVRAARAAPTPPSPAELVAMIGDVAAALVPTAPPADQTTARKPILTWWREEGHPAPATLVDRAHQVADAVATAPGLAHLRQPRGRWGQRRPVSEDLRALLRRRGEILQVAARTPVAAATGSEPPTCLAAGELRCPGPTSAPSATAPPNTWWPAALASTRTRLEADRDLAPMADHLLASLGPPEQDPAGDVRARVPNRSAARLLAPHLGRATAELGRAPVVLCWGGASSP